MSEENPLEGAGREMVPEEMLEEVPAAKEPTPAAEKEALPSALTPEEVVAHVGGVEGEAFPEGPPPAEEDKGMGAMEPLLPPEVLGETAGPQAEVPLPPPEAMRGAPVFTSAALEAPGPVGPSQPPPLGEPVPPSPEMVKQLVPLQRVQELWDRVDNLHQSVKKEISSLPLARRLLDDLQAARNYLMAGLEYYEEAERLLNEVDYRVALARRVREWSYTIGVRLLFYELAWVVVLAVGMFFLPWVIYRVGPSLGYSPNAMAGPQSVLWLVVALKSVIWGGLGGVTGALYALWRHVAREQDFDKQYTMWYITNPIMGLALGAFVYLVIQAGLFSLTASAQQNITSAAMVFVLAWVTGFQQNVAYDMVRRILQLFRIEEKPPAVETSGSPATPSRLR
ncbi:MAG TPA: hypothetical protein G4O04_01985 [Anaerolineae bacterium]|nr:hypothetical protein [Anaerolineae bacterium]HID85214.1 hypothetical protein [Anaerolineales bacterium]HIQ08117.1 hypothetical protein [Anaerolineaceae bacterium]